jgi:predicted Zn-dependent protease
VLDALVIEHHGDDGHRAEKLQRDIGLLEHDLQRQPEDARSIFYLAQSYRDLGDEERAVELYRRRAELGAGMRSCSTPFIRQERCWAVGTRLQGCLC